MKNAFDALILLLGVFFVVFTAMLDSGATMKVAVVALAVFVGYKMFFSQQVEEEHRKYHASKSGVSSKEKVVLKKVVRKVTKKKKR